MKKPLSKATVVGASILLALLNDASSEFIIKGEYEGNLVVISIVLKFARSTDTDPSQPPRWRRGK